MLFVDVSDGTRGSQTVRQEIGCLTKVFPGHFNPRPLITYFEHNLERYDTVPFNAMHNTDCPISLEEIFQKILKLTIWCTRLLFEPLDLSKGLIFY